MNRALILLFFYFLLMQQRATAQEREDVLSIKNEMMVLKLQKKLTKKQADSIFTLYSLPAISIDSLFRFRYIGKLAVDGWNLKMLDNINATLIRPLESVSNTVDWSKHPVLLPSSDKSGISKAGSPGYPADVTYGRNRFKQKVTVTNPAPGIAFFWLPANPLAQKVFLSGNFNDWSPYATPMQKTDSGWVAKVKLQPGKYFYKFIIDGNWAEDKYNNQKEDDGHQGKNSTYYHCNYVFTLNGYKGAKKVMLSGSFNDWNENELRMIAEPKGWFINMYLRDGLHTYKFIVDGQWITDPANKRLRPDGEGNFNSVTGIGDTVAFTLKGFTNANSVILSGNFNNWRTAELVMDKTTDGWKLDYMLPPGNYEYKFIVDGKWITDPFNPFTRGSNDAINSVRAVKANYVFRLKKNLDAEEVFLNGSFNDWNEPGYKMFKLKDEWVFPLHLKPGKHLYKFVVDGNWIIDPDNKNWEENEYNSGNSVLWKESK